MIKHDLALISGELIGEGERFGDPRGPERTIGDGLGQLIQNQNYF